MARPKLFECLECRRGFATVKAAERAVSIGCPKCGGSDIDLFVPGWSFSSGPSPKLPTEPKEVPPTADWWEDYDEVVS